MIGVMLPSWTSLTPDIQHIKTLHRITFDEAASPMQCDDYNLQYEF